MDQYIERKIWLVVNANFPNYITSPCYSYENAFTEAKDLAQRMPGSKFIIFESVESIVSNKLLISKHVDVTPCETAF